MFLYLICLEFRQKTKEEKIIFIFFVLMNLSNSYESVNCKLKIRFQAQIMKILRSLRLTGKICFSMPSIYVLTIDLYTVYESVECKNRINRFLSSKWFFINSKIEKVTNKKRCYYKILRSAITIIWPRILKYLKHVFNIVLQYCFNEYIKVPF